MNPINYLILGAGGTGGCIAGYLTDAGKNVTLIARNQTLEAIRRDGLLICLGNEMRSIPVRAVSEEEYQGDGGYYFCLRQRVFSGRDVSADSQGVRARDGGDSDSEYLRHRGADGGGAAGD